MEGRRDEQTDGQACRRTDKLTNGQTDTDKSTASREQTNGQRDKRMDRQRVGQTNGGTGG